MHKQLYFNLLIYTAALSTAIAACSPSSDNESSHLDVNTTRTCNANLGIPKLGAKERYEQWHLMVRKSGHKTWNGQNVGTETLKRYMIELSEMPVSAGRLVVHIEPTASCQTVVEIYNVINTSPLCLQHRCIQDRWDYDKPIVN
jgi:hypothetical protein